MTHSSDFVAFLHQRMDSATIQGGVTVHRFQHRMVMHTPRGRLVLAPAERTDPIALLRLAALYAQ